MEDATKSSKGEAEAEAALSPPPPLLISTVALSLLLVMSIAWFIGYNKRAEDE